MNKEKVNQRKLQIQQQRKKARMKRNLMLGASTLVVLLVVGFIAFNAFKPASGNSDGLGEAVDVSMQVLPHIPEGSELPAYKTNPPTGGSHYASTFPAKFFDPSELAGLPTHPEGYLVHNLEHGYVIIWYNCKNLDASSCENLKTQIKDVMGQVIGGKVIAFPWDNMDQNVALTSWNRIATMETFSPSDALKFINGNRNKSPEPNTP